MKKATSITLATILVLSLAGCAPKTTNPPANTGTNNTTSNTAGKDTTNTGKPITYKDGVYDIKHKSTKPGYEEAVVTIASGKIKDIDLKRLDANSKEVDYNTWDGKHDGYPNLKQARLDLANAMISKQSSNVDAITGCTQSSNGWKAAVSDALSKAQ